MPVSMVWVRRGPRLPKRLNAENYHYPCIDLEGVGGTCIDGLEITGELTGGDVCRGLEWSESYLIAKGGIVRGKYQYPWTFHRVGRATVSKARSAFQDVVVVREAVNAASMEAWVAQRLVS
jgi:hypothetical protein